MSTEPLNQASERLTDLNPKWWYLYGSAYDFSDFVSRHPGGAQAIILGRGRDCTALFKSYHTRLPSLDLIQKYKVQGSQDPTKEKTEKLDLDTFTFTYGDNEFYDVVKKGALKYFQDNNMHTKGGLVEIFWWLVNLSVFIVCAYYSLCVVVPIPFVSALCAIIFGISKSLMVIRSTHSASHWSFSRYAGLNRFVYWLNMSLLGDTPQQWTAKHVIAHHIDTNITPIDDDTMYPVKRVLLAYERKWFHEYQHIYIWMLYAFVYYPWTISHNIKFFMGLFFNDGIVYEGIIQCRFNTTLDWIEGISCILIHHSLRLLPFFCLPTWYHAIIISLIGEFSSSVWFSLQFAVNHETLESVWFAGKHTTIFDEKNKNRDFGSHQLITSHNYSVDYWPTLHLSGGLNYQIEHHLYPSVHYKHYPELAKIVQKAANEFNLPYNESRTFFQGVAKHYRLLKLMGNTDQPDVKELH